ncbi:MAG: hypothetical protein OQJ81_10980 [Melioribacteraceae bacterium]|nr:hypothetical protein [Melioribacteraceae bacterium]
MKHFRLLILSIIVFLSGCDDKKDSINSPIDLVSDSYTNIPVIVNTENSYTFTVNANNLNYITEDELNFSTDSLVISLTLANVRSSDGFIKVFNNNAQEIFSETLNTNKVIVLTDLKGQIPGQIKIELINFTGQLTAVVATQKP